MELYKFIKRIIVVYNKLKDFLMRMGSGYRDLLLMTREICGFQIMALIDLFQLWKPMETGHHLSQM